MAALLPGQHAGGSMALVHCPLGGRRCGLEVGAHLAVRRIAQLAQAFLQCRAERCGHASGWSVQEKSAVCERPLEREERWKCCTKLISHKMYSLIVWLCVL